MNQTPETTYADLDRANVQDGHYNNLARQLYALVDGCWKTYKMMVDWKYIYNEQGRDYHAANVWDLANALGDALASLPYDWHAISTALEAIAAHLTATIDDKEAGVAAQDLAYRAMEMHSRQHTTN